MPQDFPQVSEPDAEALNSIPKSQTQNSTDPEHSQNPSSDPLYDFLKKRKRQRIQFEHRYSRKAIGLSAYLRQIDSPENPIAYNGLLLDYKPEE